MKYIAAIASQLFITACALLGHAVRGAAMTVGAVYVAAHYGLI